MKTLRYLLILMLAISGAPASETDTFLRVTEPCRLMFPRDHGPHPAYRTEWWYYTGNLESASGKPYGFQLTFFRTGLGSPKARERRPNPPSAWRTHQIYLAHAALTDISGNRHLHAERVMREALGMAGADRKGPDTVVFITNWSVRIGTGRHHLAMEDPSFSFRLELTPVKPPVLHGAEGYSRKGSTPDRASCYYSFTRLSATGTLQTEGKSESVRGLGWMDHEFSTASLEPGIVGWDWFSLQLTDGTEIMIYLLRKSDGSLHPASSGTRVDREGTGWHLASSEFQVQVTDRWMSHRSKADYPSGWRLEIPSLAVELSIVPNIRDQEMITPRSTGVTYWEGSVTATGTRNGRPVRAQGYVELTGYAGPLDAPM